jgi:hypothetical protein
MPAAWASGLISYVPADSWDCLTAKSKGTVALAIVCAESGTLINKADTIVVRIPKKLRFIAALLRLPQRSPN